MIQTFHFYQVEYLHTALEICLADTLYRNLEFHTVANILNYRIDKTIAHRIHHLHTYAVLYEDLMQTADHGASTKKNNNYVK